MIDLDVVALARLQFAATALYHFLFVPLTLGLSFLLAIMESVYVMTGREIWRRMTIFWGTLFGINFAMGVATGVVMEFQFGMDWAYYSHYVGDIFGAPLAIEGLMAFFLEATFVGLFFFGWDRLSKVGHLTVTWLVAFGANFSALWILIANGWMQNPVGAKFNPDTMRMEIANFSDILFNTVAQAKFVHTVSAGYVTGSVFVMGVSAWYLLKGRHIEIAKRSMAVAASFGLAASLSAVVLGDESGYLATENQKMKVAGMESMWHTEPAPAAINVIAIPDMAKQDNSFAIQIPYLLGIIATRSLDTQLPGIVDLVNTSKDKIRSGILAYAALQKVRADKTDTASRATLDQHWKDLGYGLLLKKIRPDVENATEAEITQAANETIPNVPVLFWGFRVMVAFGFYFIGFFAVAFWVASRHQLGKWRWMLWGAVFTLPLPWITVEMGWIVAELGRQPWIIEGVLPTFYAASSLTVADIAISLTIFVLLYSALLVVELYLLRHTIQKGPAERDPLDDPSGARVLPIAAAAEPEL
ncbi:cytochrome d terminal oxidase subunit 1 [Kaistia algarum]|nr:cytochrome d terminal oxidase subunit 1 [Kaistia algarum]